EGFSVKVSLRALIIRCPMDVSFAQRGISPQRISRIFLSSPSCRMTGRFWVGAMLNRGRWRETSSAEARNRRRRAFSSTVRVKRPHTGILLSKPKFPILYFPVSDAFIVDGKIGTDRHLPFRFTK